MAVISNLLLFLLLSSSDTACVHHHEASDYSTKELAIRVDESSHSPAYLAIQFLNLGPQTEIVAVDVAQFGSQNWNFMSRRNDAVWETKRVPSGSLQFRVVVTAGLEGKWYLASKVMPEDWRNGEIYDTGLHITDIAMVTAGLDSSCT